MYGAKIHVYKIYTVNLPFFKLLWPSMVKKKSIGRSQNDFFTLFLTTDTFCSIIIYLAGIGYTIYKDKLSKQDLWCSVIRDRTVIVQTGYSKDRFLTFDASNI